jgi:CheY-like chemotaxis protein
LRILLVEDHQDTATLLGKLLRRCGHDVSIANSRADALRLAASGPFDVMLSDIGLPDGTGHELMREIRQHHAIPGIALTGYGMEEDVSRSRDAGFVEHVVKPVNIEHLQAVLSRAARR